MSTICVLYSSISFAQVTPSELADLSMQDLLQMSIRDLVELNIHDDTAGKIRDQGKWSFNYGYRKLRIDGYRSGTNDLSDAEVLFEPAKGEARTNNNFLIVPTKIDQEVHTFNIGYSFSEDLRFNLFIPYIKQSTDHISIVPGFESFTFDTDGMGDISLHASYTLPFDGKGEWVLTGGLSIPTGSIDEKNDTPRNGAGTIEQLPYTMQLGSGTYDVPISLIYLSYYQRLIWGSQLTARIRIGENDRDYSLGNFYQAGIWGRYRTTWWVHPGLKLSYQHAEEIGGRDEALVVPGAFPFPASITNPDNYGGDKINAVFMLRLCKPDALCSKYIDLEFSKPIYQDLNGIQPKEDYQIALSLGFDL